MSLKPFEVKELENNSRPNWDRYFLDLCEAVARRATCDRGRSGCVIVKDKRIMTTGYVGPPADYRIATRRATTCERFSTATAT